MKNLIWQTKIGDEQFSLQYIKDFLLKGIDYKEIFDGGECKVFLDDSIIVYSCCNDLPKKLEEYFKKYDELKYKYYIIHTSNEARNEHDFTHYKNAKHVFREYYDPKTDAFDNVTTIPLGYKTGFLNEDREGLFHANNKEYLWAFIGQVGKSDRVFMYDHLKTIGPHFVHSTSQWDCPTSLSVEKSIEIYKKTFFVPCPMGWLNPDSFRINEALEWGCVPIVKKYPNFDGINYYKHVYGDNIPFIVVNEWNECPKIMMDLCNNVDILNKLMYDIQIWYNIFRKNLQIDFQNKLK
jgi:hypothetical protein